MIGNDQIWAWHYPDEHYRRKVLEQASLLLRGVTADTLETQIVCKDGSIKTIDWFSRTLVDSENQIQGAIAFGYDITERKKAEEALIRTHKELSALYNIASATSGALDLETALERSLEQVLPVMKSNKDFIHLWQDDSQELLLAASKGIHESSISDLLNVSVKDSSVNRVFIKAEAIAIPNIITELDDAPKIVPKRLFHSYLGVPIKTKGKVIGVFSILGESDRIFSNDEISLLTSIGEQIGVVVDNARLYNQSRKLAVLEERRRLARELHDAVTQSLYSLTLFAESGQRSLKTGNYLDADFFYGELGKTAESALREMRLLLYELRPVALEKEGLLDAIQYRLDAVERRLGIKALMISECKFIFPYQVEQELYRIIQEALNNILRHSSAKTVTISFNCKEDRMMIVISDDGIGFDIGKIDERKCMGLTGMRERACKLGGALEIESVQGQGTSVSISLAGKFT